MQLKKGKKKKKKEGGKKRRKKEEKKIPSENFEQSSQKQTNKQTINYCTYKGNDRT